MWRRHDAWQDNKITGFHNPAAHFRATQKREPMRTFTTIIKCEIVRWVPQILGLVSATGQPEQQKIIPLPRVHLPQLWPTAEVSTFECQISYFLFVCLYAFDHLYALLFLSVTGTHTPPSSFFVFFFFHWNSPPNSLCFSVSDKMGSLETERTVKGWAARDSSGVLSPYTYTLR